jgi:photosystem II stability/assembly factor-like uncharacterized protein
MALLFVLGAFADSRPGNFHVVGPGGGGAMFHPTISPHDPNTALVSCDMTGSYITHDGGKSWRMFNLRGVVQFFVFDPLKSDVIYAQATGLWRSQDNGETWALVYPRPYAVKAVKMNSDHSDEDIVAEPNPLGGSVSAMAIDPADSERLYVAAGDRRQGKAALFTSTDGGQTWEKKQALTDLATHLWVDPGSPREDRTLIVAGSRFIAKQTSSNLQQFPSLPSKNIQDLSAGFQADGKAIVYAVGDDSAFVYQEGSTAWLKINLGGAGAKMRAIATSLRNPQAAYVSYSQLNLGGSKWLGVAKTVDTGHTWNLVWKENSDPAAKSAPNIHDAWITDRFGPDWGENPLALGVADQDPNLAYGTDLGRTMLTTDGGANWVAMYSRKSGSGWVSTGLDVTTTYGYHFDPFDPNRRFITTTDIGLFRSEDGGNSWVSSTQGVPKDWLNTTYWIEFDPQVKGRIWSVNSWTHDLPRPKMWRRKGIGDYRGGVCRSDDGGETWTKSNEGMKPSAVTHILLDPTSPTDARVLYVAAFGRGVYKSTDTGKSWVLKNAGITQKEPFAWRIVRDSQGTLYVLIARRSEDGSIGNSGDGAIYRSTNGAETWSSVSMPEGSNAPNGLAVDPANPSRLYLAAWARATGQHGEGGGIYLSENAGKTWRQVLDRDRHVYDVTIDPRDPNLMYAAGFESSAWRSTDRGENWTRIPGFNFKWGHRVIPDPRDPKKVYITTFGGGVWYGSVDGPDRPVDIVTPELQPGR